MALVACYICYIVPVEPITRDTHCTVPRPIRWRQPRKFFSPGGTCTDSAGARALKLENRGKRPFHLSEGGFGVCQGCGHPLHRSPADPVAATQKVFFPRGHLHGFGRGARAEARESAHVPFSDRCVSHMLSIMLSRDFNHTSLPLHLTSPSIWLANFPFVRPQTYANLSGLLRPQERTRAT